MKRKSLFDHFRLSVLIIGASILGANTVFYYEAQASQQIPVGEVSPIAEMLALASPSPSVVPSASPSYNISNVNLTKIKTLDEARIQAAQTSFTGGVISTPINQVNVFSLSYDIIGKSQKPQPITAQVFVPNNDGSYPLFIFGSGTTGMSDACAPSLENIAVENLGNYENHMIAQAAEGYVTVFPDYEGFHSGETQAYFISESEAKVLLGAIKSIIELQERTPELKNANTKEVFLSGYSQGGHAALSAAQAWSALPDTVTLKGVVQFAGAADVQALFIESPWLASYLVDSYTQYYGEQLDPRLVLQDRWLISLAKNNSELCVNQAYKFYPHTPGTMYNPSFLDAVQTSTWPTNLSEWQSKITQNIPHADLPNVPYLSIQGETDPIVTAKTQRNNVAVLCRDNKDVQYREYPGVNHFQIRQASFAYTNQWLKSVSRGELQKADCL